MKKSKIAARRVTPYEQLQNKVAYAWTRVSSERQKKDGSSLATQEEDILAYAKKNGIRIKDQYGRGVESGTKAERKEFDRMIADARNDKQVNVILCYDSKRFGRLGGDTISLKDKLLAEGIYVIYTGETNYDRNDAGGYYADGIRDLGGKVDVNYRYKICADGIVHMLNRGEWCFHVPLGYTRVKLQGVGNAKHHVIEINETGELLRNAWIWRAEGQRIIDIVHKLNALGLRMSNGQPIHEKRLSKILQDPFYAGWIEHELIETENHRIRGNYEALIDETTFNLANGLSHAGYEQKEETTPFPLKKHIRCDSCGHFMTGYPRARKKKMHYYYKCNTIGCCCNRNADDLHDAYNNLLTGYKVREELLPIVKKMIEHEMENYLSNSEKSLKVLRSRYTESSNKMGDVEYKFALGDIPKSSYDVAKRRLQEEMENIDAQISEIENLLSNTFPSIDKIVLMCCKLGDLWQKSSFSDRQKLQNLAFPDGVRYNHILGNYRTPDANKVLTLIHEISDSYEDNKSKSDFDLSSKSPFVEKT